jgi:hypothetical protein
MSSPSDDGKFTMNTANIEKWNEIAWERPAADEKPSVPFHVLLGEAVDVARFAQRNWEPALGPQGQIMRPGLGSAAGNGTLSSETVDELLELVDALQTAQTKYRLLVSGPPSTAMERAQFVLSEVRATLEWAFDDGQLTDEDHQLDTLVTEHDSALSQDAVAAALYDYAELAERAKDKLQGLGGFDVALIAEARALGAQLRERSAGPATFEPKPAERDALELRNRLVSLLSERVARLRAAARFVFRRHPVFVREVSSAYERRRRASSRKKKEEEVTLVGMPAGEVSGV